MRLPESLPTFRGPAWLAIRAVWLVVFAVALLSVTWGRWDKSRTSRLASETCYSLGIACEAESFAMEVAGGPAASSTRPTGGYARSGAAIREETGAVDTAAKPRHDGGRGSANVRSGRGLGALSLGQVQAVDLALRWATGLLTLAMAALLFQRRGRAPVVAMISLGLLLTVADDAADGLGSAALAAWLDHGNALGGMLLVCGLLLFPEGRFVPHWTLAAVGSVPLAWAAMLGAGRADLYLAVLLGYFLLALLAIGQRFRMLPPGEERQQIKWALLGTAFTTLCYAGAAGLGASPLAEDGGHRLAAVLGGALLVALGTLALPAGLVLSLLRIRLYDAESAIARSAAYALLTVTLVALFAASAKLVEVTSEYYLGGQIGVLAGGLAAALVAVTINPLHHRALDWAERRFRRGLLLLRRGLPQLVGDLRETAGRRSLAAAIVGRTAEGSRASAAALIVGSEVVATHAVAPEAIEAWRQRWTPAEGTACECDRGDPFLPLRVPLSADGVGRVGWLLLSPRPDGSFYARDEREALAEVADPIARAIAIVWHREAAAAEQERAIQALEDRIERLEALLKSGT